MNRYAQPYGTDPRSLTVDDVAEMVHTLAELIDLDLDLALIVKAGGCNWHVAEAEHELDALADQLEQGNSLPTPCDPRGKTLRRIALARHTSQVRA